jgi:hypothetical protein
MAIMAWTSLVTSLMAVDPSMVAHVVFASWIPERHLALIVATALVGAAAILVLMFLPNQGRSVLEGGNPVPANPD